MNYSDNVKKLSYIPINEGMYGSFLYGKIQRKAF